MIFAHSRTGIRLDNMSLGFVPERNCIPLLDAFLDNSYNAP